METIFVESNLAAATPPEDPEAAHPVALWERDTDHPEGEIFIAGPGVHEVAATPAVNLALHEKRLVKLDAPPVRAARLGPGAAVGKDEPEVKPARPDR